MATSSRKPFVCGWCLNTGARPFGLPEKPDWMPQERWDKLYGERPNGRWTRCLACNANFFDKRTGPELAESLTHEQRMAVLASPSNRGF